MNLIDFIGSVILILVYIGVMLLIGRFMGFNKLPKEGDDDHDSAT